jgi:hypothetical protein
MSVAAPLLTTLERRLLPLVAAQGLVTSLWGFCGVFAYNIGGLAAAQRYAVLMLTTTMLGVTLGYGAGRWFHLRSQRLVQAAFVWPGLLLWWADGHPDVLAVAFGSFLGLGWAGRHWLEVNLLPDAERDRYASHVTVLTVAMNLLATLATTLLLTWFDEQVAPVLRAYAVLCLLAAAVVARGVPETPRVRLESPWGVVSQPEFVRCLPLFMLESGLLGVAMVLGASGAVRSLGAASHFGWLSTAATLVGALALFALRRHRHAHNRARWMAFAGTGVVLASLLLGASAWWPALYGAHLVLQAGVGPFWAASEQVLNQRTLDIKGAVADRIAARETTLWAFRMVGLGGFWLLAQRLDDRTLLGVGAGLMACATALEYGLGRLWLRRQPQPVTGATVLVSGD